MLPFPNFFDLLFLSESKQIEMKTYSNTLFFAENSEKERIDHFDIRLVFPHQIIVKITFQRPPGAELPWWTDICVRLSKLPERRKGKFTQKKQQIVKNIPPIVYTKKQQQIVKNIPPSADREDVEVQS